MGILLRVMRRIFLPRWFTSRLRRGARWVVIRVTTALLVVGSLLMLVSLWRDVTYTWPSRRVARLVAETAGVTAHDRRALIVALETYGFNTLATGMTRDETAAVFANADLHEELTRRREAYYFTFVDRIEYGFYLDYDTADTPDRLTALSWRYDYLLPQEPRPLTMGRSPRRLSARVGGPLSAFSRAACRRVSSMAIIPNARRVNSPANEGEPNPPPDAQTPDPVPPEP